MDLDAIDDELSLSANELSSSDDDVGLPNRRASMTAAFEGSDVSKTTSDTPLPRKYGVLDAPVSGPWLNNIEGSSFKIPEEEEFEENNGDQEVQELTATASDSHLLRHRKLSSETRTVSASNLSTSRTRPSRETQSSDDRLAAIIDGTDNALKQFDMLVMVDNENQ